MERIDHKFIVEHIDEIHAGRLETLAELAPRCCGVAYPGQAQARYFTLRDLSQLWREKPEHDLTCVHCGDRVLPMTAIGGLSFLRVRGVCRTCRAVRCADFGTANGFAVAAWLCRGASANSPSVVDGST